MATMSSSDMVLNVSVSSYQKHINQLQSYISTLAQQKEKLRSYRSQIDNIWKGESAAQYTNLMDKEIAKVDQAQQALTKTLEAIQNILNTTQEQNSAVNAQIQDAAATIDSLF